MIQKDGFKCRLEYANVSIDNNTYIAKEPIEFPFINIFFDETISEHGGKQKKIHFRFKDKNGKLIQVVAYFNPYSKEDVDLWNRIVPMERNKKLIG